jgi:hypothetical protein
MHGGFLEASVTGTVACRVLSKAVHTRRHKDQYVAKAGLSNAQVSHRSDETPPARMALAVKIFVSPPFAGGITLL